MLWGFAHQGPAFQEYLLENIELEIFVIWLDDLAFEFAILTSNSYEDVVSISLISFVDVLSIQLVRRRGSISPKF